MLRYLVRRLLLLVPILLGVSLLIFFWIRALPGTPAESLLGERATPALVQVYRHRYGLDKPVYVQYWSYLKTTASGDLGVSVASRRTVVSEIKRSSGNGRVGGRGNDLRGLLRSAARVLRRETVRQRLRPCQSRRLADRISIPIFFLAIILKYIFAVRLGWLPSVGRISITIDAKHPTNFYILDAIITRDWSTLWDVIKHLILPAIALGSIPLAIITRITRASVLDVQNEDYVRTARAKGLPPSTVDRRHVLRNALLPVTTIIGLQTGLLLSGRS